MDYERPYPDEKSEDELDHSKSEDVDATFAPIACPATNDGRRDAPMQKQRSNASRSLERSWSLNDGVSIGGDEYEGQEADEAGPGTDGEDGYTVAWEENDSMNPRNMNKARKWLVVIIVSTGSLCVCVILHIGSFVFCG